MPELPETSCYETYNHHGSKNWVRSDLKGKHRDHCLCHNCRKFDPGCRELNCKIANMLFDICVLCNLVTPVWECPHFVAKDEKKYLQEDSNAC